MGTRSQVVEGTVIEMSAEPFRRTVSAWRIRAGRFNGVDVSGQVVLAISSRGGRALGGRGRQVVLIDERASPEQVLALLDAFRGRRDPPDFCQVPIESSVMGERADISVPDRLRLIIDLDRLVASEVSVAMPEHGLGWLARDVSVSCRAIRLEASGEEKTCHG